MLMLSRSAPLLADLGRARTHTELGENAASETDAAAASDSTGGRSDDGDSSDAGGENKQVEGVDQGVETQTAKAGVAKDHVAKEDVAEEVTRLMAMLRA